MRLLLPESMMNMNTCSKETEVQCLLEKAPLKKGQMFKTLPLVDDVLGLLRTRSVTMAHSPFFFPGMKYCNRNPL